MTGVNALPAHIKLGKAGETAAAEFLQRQGFRIIVRNWRWKNLEIDMICENGDQIIFVEVKTRQNAHHGGAVSAITPRKMKNLFLAARAWLNLNSLWHRPCRFDVVCLTGKNGNFLVEHYRDAFESHQIMDYSHTSWQY